MRISDWSSDVCSSDLQRRSGPRPQQRRGARGDGSAVGDDPAGGLLLRVDRHRAPGEGGGRADQRRARARGHLRLSDRKSVVEGKSVSVRVDLGGRRIIKKKKQNV